MAVLVAGAAGVAVRAAVPAMVAVRAAVPVMVAEHLHNPPPHRPLKYHPTSCSPESPGTQRLGNGRGPTPAASCLQLRRRDSIPQLRRHRGLQAYQLPIRTCGRRSSQHQRCQDNPCNHTPIQTCLPVDVERMLLCTCSRCRLQRSTAPFLLRLSIQRAESSCTTSLLMGWTSLQGGPSRS